MNSTNNSGQKHIAMYIGSLQKGGAERVMVNLAQYFCSEGYRVTFVTTYLAVTEYEVPHAAWKVLRIGSETGSDSEAASGSDICSVLTVDGEPAQVSLHGGCKAGEPEIDRVFSAVAQEEAGGRLNGFQKRCDRLRSIWTSLHPDLILSFSGKNNVMAIMTSFGLGIPVVVSVRSNPSREYAQRLLRMAMLSTFRHAAGVVLQTNGAMAYFPRAIQERAVILPNSIHPAFMRTPFAGKERDKNIVSVGRLDENKNQALLIRAFAKVTGEHPMYQMILYGDGPSRHALEQLSAELHVEKKVQFAGIVDNIPEKISRSGIFVLSSDQEGMPNALIEAMSLGIPCISTDCPCGGPRDLIQDRENGLLTPVRNVDKMAESLRYLMEDPARAFQMGQKAALVQKEYSPEKINARWKSYLDGLMK